MIPSGIEVHLSPEEIQSTGVDAIAVNLLPYIVAPGMELLKASGGLGSWLRWPGKLIAVMGLPEDYEQGRIQVAEAGSIIS